MDDATNRQLLQDHFATLKTGADTVSTAAGNMATPVGAYHDATVALGAQTASQINTLELTISLTAIAGGLLALFSLGTSAEAAEAAIDADVLATADAIQTSYRASQMTRVIGLTSLAVGAVGAIHAFHALPAIDLDKAIKNLAAIIVMKAIIDDDDSRPRKIPTSGSGKDKASDIPSWARGERPYVGESGKDFAKRVLDERYGDGEYPTGPGSEYNKLKKWGDRGFRNP